MLFCNQLYWFGTTLVSVFTHFLVIREFIHYDVLYRPLFCSYWWNSTRIGPWTPLKKASYPKDAGVVEVTVTMPWNTGILNDLLKEAALMNIQEAPSHKLFFQVHTHCILFTFLHPYVPSRFMRSCDQGCTSNKAESWRKQWAPDSGTLLLSLRSVDSVNSFKKQVKTKIFDVTNGNSR